MKESVKQQDKDAILRALAYHFPNAKVYLFGSRAEGTHQPGSDIDVAIDGGTKADVGEMYRARITLENLPVPFQIDLLDMQAIPRELKEFILKKGILWKS